MSKRRKPQRGMAQAEIGQSVTPELQTWIVAQAQAGCAPEAVLQAMLASGWQHDVAVSAMETTLAQHLAATGAGANDARFGSRALAPNHAATGGGTLASLPAGAIPEPDLSAGACVLDLGDRRVSVLMRSSLPRVLLLGGFLSDAECEAMRAAAEPRLARSETVVHDTGGSEVNQARTSRGMFFERGETEVCARIEQRIAALCRWPVENGEGLQVLHYQPGAEYQPHYDYFDPTQPGARTILARGGQRVATLVMYLNTPERGGGTTFPDAGLEVAPIQGNAVFFSYDRADPATRSLHAGAPVLAGEKWVATKWLREREFR
jgi:prolyl 4-hydroxylase